MHSYLDDQISDYDAIKGKLNSEESKFSSTGNKPGGDPISWTAGSQSAQAACG